MNPLDSVVDTILTTKTNDKFTDAEMSDELIDAARLYVKTYGGTFEFILDLQGKKTLSIGQLRGALNCYRAEVLKTNKPTPTSVAITGGTGFARISTLFDAGAEHLKWPKIRLAIGDTNIVLRRCGAGSKTVGAINVESKERYWNERFQNESPKWYGRINTDGSLNSSKCMTDAIVDLLAEFAADPAGVAAKYGKLTGNCCFCGLQLTDERSTVVGYGPTCADHYALPWGEKS